MEVFTGEFKECVWEWCVVFTIWVMGSSRGMEGCKEGYLSKVVMQFWHFQGSLVSLCLCRMDASCWTSLHIFVFRVGLASKHSEKVVDF